MVGDVCQLFGLCELHPAAFMCKQGLPHPSSIKVYMNRDISRQFSKGGGCQNEENEVYVRGGGG